MELPNLQLTPTEIFRLQYGTIRSWLLICAVDFEIFDLTVNERSAQEIATALKAHEKNTELFLNALCSINLLTKQNGRYRNTELSDTFLVSSSDTYLGGTLRLNETWNFQTKDEMKERIQKGPLSSGSAPDFSGDYFADYIRDMRNLSRSGISQRIADEISQLQDFGDMRRMLDLGGAHGMDSIALAMKNPDLEAVVFDNSMVIETTKEVIAEYQMTDRITVRGGDYESDSLGSSYDLIYAKATLNLLKEGFEQLFRRIHGALNDEGVFISLHDGLRAEGTQPADIVISWLSPSLSSGDFSIDEDEIPNALLRAGFRSVRSKPFPFFLGGELDMVVARK